MKARSVDNRHCAACGFRIYQHESEDPCDFLRRLTCLTDSCRQAFRSEGRQFPEYREQAAQVPQTPLVARAVPDALLRLRLLPAWLLQPVENRVGNP